MIHHPFIASSYWISGWIPNQNSIFQWRMRISLKLTNLRIEVKEALTFLLDQRRASTPSSLLTSETSHELHVPLGTRICQFEWHAIAIREYAHIRMPTFRNASESMFFFIPPSLERFNASRCMQHISGSFSLSFFWRFASNREKRSTNAYGEPVCEVLP